MPRLCALTVRGEGSIYEDAGVGFCGPPQNYTKDEWTEFLEGLADECIFEKQALALDHLQQVAGREKQRAQLLYKEYIELESNDVVSLSRAQVDLHLLTTLDRVCGTCQRDNMGGRRSR